MNRSNRSISDREEPMKSFLFPEYRRVVLTSTAVSRALLLEAQRNRSMRVGGEKEKVSNIWNTLWQGGLSISSQLCALFKNILMD